MIWETNELSGQPNILTVKIDTVFETLNILRSDFDIWRSSLVAQMVKNLPEMQESWLQSGLGRSPGEGNGYPLQYSYLENSMEIGALAGYSPWGRKESDMTEWLHFHFLHSISHLLSPIQSYTCVLCHQAKMIDSLFCFVFFSLQMNWLEGYQSKLISTDLLCWDQYISDFSMCSDAQCHLILYDPMDYSPPASSVHETFQSRILEWVGISLSRESFQSRDWTCISCLFCIGRQILYYQHHLGWPYNLFCLQLCVSFICDILRELSLKLE